MACWETPSRSASSTRWPRWPRRSRPGLQPQHLKSVEAAGKICSAEITGAAPGSTELFFSPGDLHGRHYRFDIGTAGSTSLVLQTIFLPLSRAGSASSVTVSGGTHVPWSPCYDYLELLWLPFMRRVGLNARLALDSAGFYPQGGGQIRAQIEPAGPFHPIHLTERGGLQRIRGLSAVANLDPEIARRQKLQALRQLEPLCRDTKIGTVDLPAHSMGTCLVLLAEFEHSQACYFALGAPGKRAERVADEAVGALQAFLQTDGAVDQYLADQLILPLASGSEASSFRTSQVTAHLLTQVDIVRSFLPARIQIDGEIGTSGLVRITP